MKRKSMALLLCVCILFSCTACQTDQEALYSQAMSQQNEQSVTEPSVDPNDPGYLGLGTPAPEDRLTPIPNDEMKGKIVVKLYQQKSWDANIQTLAREFMLLHPQVTVTIDYEMGYYERLNLTQQEQNIQRESFYTELRTELVSGEADYLLFDCGDGLNLTFLSLNGVLEDLSPYLENEATFSENNFYMPVVDAFQVEGKQTLIPMSFTWYQIYFDRNLLEKIGIDPMELQSVTTLQVLDWYDLLRNSYPQLRLFYSGPGKDEMFPLERTAYIDLEAGISKFDSPEFVDFLARTTQVLNDEPNLNPEWVGKGTLGLADDALMYQATGELDSVAQFWQNSNKLYDELMTEVMPYFAFVDISTPNRGLMITQQPLDYLAGPYLLTNSKGEAGIMAYDCFAMPTSMKNKDLAWEFIKYCMNEREDTRFNQDGYSWDYTDYIPISKANWKQIVERVSSGIGISGSMATAPNTFNGIDVDAVMNELESVVSNPLIPVDYYNVDVQDYLDEFYKNGLTTAEECAQKIQGRAEIWLNE